MKIFHIIFATNCDVIEISSADLESAGSNYPNTINFMKTTKIILKNVNRCRLIKSLHFLGQCQLRSVV